MAKQHKMLGGKPGKENLLIKRTKSKPESVTEALTGMKGGETRTGFLGDGNTARKPDLEVAPEELDKDMKAYKKAIQRLLSIVITPNQLSNKSSPEMDKRSMVNKFNKSSLDELNRLLPKKVRGKTTKEVQDIIDGVTELSDEDKADIQTLYLEVSP